MESQTEKREIEIDLKQLFGELLKRIWIIILVTGIAGIATLIVSMFFIKPTYESTTKVYILSKQSDTAISYNDLQTATQLTGDYEQLIKSRYVMDTVIANLGLEMDPDTLSGNISVNAATGTRMLNITVQNGDPYTAQKIADHVRTVAGKQIVDIMSIDAVNVVDEANLPLSPSSPNSKKNAVIGALAGFLLCCGVIIVKYLLNDTIRTPEDIENYLGMSVLGTIPYSEGDTHRNGKTTYRKKKRKGSKA